MSNLPSIVSTLPPDLKRFLDRVREAFGNGANALVTTNDLVNGGFASLDISGNLMPPSGIITPPAPTNVVASGAMTSVILDWDEPTYRGHSYAEIWRAPADNIGIAQLIGQSPGAVFSDAVGNGATNYYWVRFVSTSNTLGPFNGTAGTLGETSPDPAYLLTLLTSEITSSQLATSLAARINLIDGPSTTVGTIPNLLSQLQGQIDALSSYPDYDGATTYTIDQIVKYGGAIYRTTGTTTGHLPTDTAHWEKIGDYTSLGDAVAAHTAEIGTLTTDLAAESTARSSLATQMRGGYTGTDITAVTSGLVYNESQARATADSSLATSITALSATVSSNASASTAALATEASTRATADTALSSSITALSSTVSSNASAATAALSTESATRASADTALSTSISTLSSTVSGNNTAITAALGTESSTRASADTALSNSITSLTSTVNSNNSTITAALSTESSTRASADTALASSITALTSTVSGNTAAITSEATTRASADAALSTSITTLSSTVAGNTAAISTEAGTRATQTGQLYAQYTVKIDVNGYVTGFGLASTAVDSTPYSAFAVRADSFYIASPSGPGVVSPATPFIVRTTATTINGVSVPVGVYITDTFIQNGSIANAKIGNAAIDTAKISDAAITYAKIADAAIGTAKIQTAAITNALIGTEAVDTSNIRAAAITTAKIQNAAIVSALIANASIGTAHIVDAAITNAKIASLSADKITAGTISADRIAANSITAAKIDSRGLTIKDAYGNIIFGSGYGLDWGQIVSQPSNIYNGNITIGSDGTLYGAGGGSVSLGGLGAGAMARIDQINSSNVWTYIGAAAIGTAFITNAAITNAKIGDAEVDTLKISGNAVSFGNGISGSGAQGFYTATGGTLVAIGYGGGSYGDSLCLYSDAGADYFPHGTAVWANTGGDSGYSYIEAYGPNSGVSIWGMGAGSHYVGIDQPSPAYNSPKLIWMFFQR